MEKLKEIIPPVDKHKAAEASGWLAIALIQGATAPSIIGNLLGWSKSLPPLSMVIMIWAGLALFCWRCHVRGDIVGVVSNLIGFALQSLILSIYAFRG